MTRFALHTTNERQERPAVVAARALHAVLLLAWFGGALAASPEQITELMEQNRADEAVAAARELVASRPTDPDAHVLLGNALFVKARLAAGHPTEAGAATIPMADAEAIAAEFESAIKLAPVRKDIYLGLVDVWSAAGDSAAMIRQIERTAKQFPSDVNLMNGLMDYGLERQSRGDPVARQILDAVHRSYPNRPEAVLAWSTYLLGANDLDGAARALEGGLQASGEDVNILESIGDAYTYRREFQAAVTKYARASELAPSRRAVRLKWAAVLHVLDPRSAKTVLGAFELDTAPRTKAPTIPLGDTQKLPSRVQKGANLIYRSVTDPNLTGTDALGVARTLWSMELPPESIALTQVALAKDASLVEAWVLRSEIYAKLGAENQAIESLTQAESILDAAPDRTFAYSRDEVIGRRAAALTRAGRFEDALATYARARDTSRYTFQMALLEERLGRVDKARALFERVAASGAVTGEVQASKERLEREPYRKSP